MATHIKTRSISSITVNHLDHLGSITLILILSLNVLKALRHPNALDSRQIQYNNEKYPT